MTEIRNLVMKYAEVISQYYIEYITGYDSVMLAELAQRFATSELSEYESLLVHSCLQSLANIKSKYLIYKYT